MSPVELGVTSPIKPSILDEKETSRSLAGISASLVVASKTTSTPSVPAEPSSGAVISHAGAVLVSFNGNNNILGRNLSTCIFNF